MWIGKVEMHVNTEMQEQLLERKHLENRGFQGKPTQFMWIKLMWVRKINQDSKLQIVPHKNNKVSILYSHKFSTFITISEKQHYKLSAPFPLSFEKSEVLRH
jgi:hypothetical protein